MYVTVQREQHVRGNRGMRGSPDPTAQGGETWGWEIKLEANQSPGNRFPAANSLRFIFQYLLLLVVVVVIVSNCQPSPGGGVHTRAPPSEECTAHRSEPQGQRGHGALQVPGNNRWGSCGRHPNPRSWETRVRCKLHDSTHRKSGETVSRC